MKLTPELKAHRAYGYARRKVHEAKETLAYDRHAKKYGKLKNAQNVLSCGKFMLKAAIRDAWKKRAACRAFLPKTMKNCHTCEYGAYFKVSPCAMCDDNFSSWKSRKEGE